MTSLPRISIITPSLNQAGFIEQTILSVLGQDYPNLEYIVIDGGSTDGSVDIIRKYEGRIAYWVSESDRGQAHAINKGLRRATGSIIAWLNSDDYYLEGTLAGVADSFSRHPDADLLHGRCRVVDQYGTKIGERVGSITQYDEILDLWDVWWKKRNFVQPEVFWTKRITDRIGPLCEELSWVMDYEYWLRMFRANCSVCFIDSELAAFRMQPNQKSVQAESSVKEMLEVVRPFIFDDNHSIGWRKRLELKGKWIYQVEFQNEVLLSRRNNETRRGRLARLLWFSITHPELFAAHTFRARLVNTSSIGRLKYFGRSSQGNGNVR
jgi:glycosyltransferase involved in cell wall biosynthesis